MICLQAIFIFSFLGYEEMLGEEYKYPEWSIKVGWAVTCSSVLCIPMYIIYKFCFASKGNCRERYNETFKVETNCNSVIPGQQGTNVWHGVEHNRRNENDQKKCSPHFNNIQKDSPTTAKLSNSQCLNKSGQSKNILNNCNTHTNTPKTTTTTITAKDNPKQNQNQINYNDEGIIQEPAYDISFKFKTKPDKDQQDLNSLRSNPLRRSSSKTFDSIDDHAIVNSCSCISCQSSHCNLVICNVCSRHFVENDYLNHFYYRYETADSAVNAAAAFNAEDNNKIYTMILSRSCKPLKFSFASEWLV